MNNIIIVTDCTDNKLTALQRVCNHNFGINAFEIKYFKDTLKEEAPKTFEELSTLAYRKIDRLVRQYETTDTTTPIYFATLQKGFLWTDRSYLLTAYALFGSTHFFPGMSESVPLKIEINSLLELPDAERYEKMSGVYPLFEVKPLIACINQTSEVEWYMQALRTCVPVAKNS